jgi:serine/threonine-protein kinase
MLEAVISAETASIVHRDIKPENIICDTAGDFWLIDFGIARHLTLSSLTATWALWGRLTLGYAPKEQMRNEKLEIDSRADLFALGITVVESYTGSNPFRHHAISDLEIVRRVEGLSISNPFAVSQLEVEFGDLICTMLQKRRDLRPRNANATLQWLTEIETRHGVI